MISASRPHFQKNPLRRAVKNYVSYQGIFDILNLIFPQSKDMVFRDFNHAMKKVEIPPLLGVFKGNRTFLNGLEHFRKIMYFVILLRQ
jgi:hypothetical protein